MGYVVSRFPKITETFILREILALEQRGFRVELFPLVLVQEERVHQEALRLKNAAHWLPLWGTTTLLAQVYWLRRSPLTYLHLWLSIIVGNLSSLKFLLRSLVVLPKAACFARKAAELGCSHMHAHFATHATLAAYIVNRLTGIPYSFTAHAHDLYVEKPMLGKKVEKSKFIVAISKFNQRYLENLFGEAAASRTHVIHCGVDPDKFLPARTFTRKETGTRLICIASMEEYKGHAVLLEACRILKRDGIPYQCTLVGGGELEKELKRKVAALGLAKSITFTGRLPQHEVLRLLAESDLLVLPSVITPKGKMEGIPVVLMEALAMEIPVVCSDISGISELVRDGETGILVPERDPAALAAGIRRHVDNPAEAVAMARAGRLLVLEEFDLAKNVEAMASLFQGSAPVASRV